MVLPALSKNWQFDVNALLPSSGSHLLDCQRLILKLKTSLLSFASYPWTVTLSCDGVTVGAAGEDLWVEPGDLVWQTADFGTNRSWCVLRQETGLELLLECRNSTSGGIGKALRIVLSPSVGFTGGSLTSRPTAADEVVLADGTSSGGTWGVGSVNNTNSFDSVLHVWHSDDGQVSMWAICIDGDCTSFAYFGAPESPVEGWTSPRLGIWTGVSGSPPVAAATFTQLYEGVGSIAAAVRAAAGFPAGTAPIFLSSEGANDGTRVNNAGQPLGRLFLTVNQITNEWELSQIGVVCLTSGSRGKHGRLFDARWAPAALVSGDTSIDGSRVVLGDLALPWNRSVPMVA